MGTPRLSRLKNSEHGTYASVSRVADSPSLGVTAASRPPPAPSVRWTVHAPDERIVNGTGAAPDLVPSLGWKRVADVLGALTLLAIFIVPMVIITLLARADGDRALFRQTRIGHQGRRFTCLKFRTMRPNAEQVLEEVLAKDPAAKAEWERTRKLRDDPRLTRVGVFLRRTSLDELPQLLNVLRGEMSLVGPRPIVEEELMRYGSRLRWYEAVRPGITGLWQVSGRNDTSYSRRVALDVLYVKNMGLRFDLQILWRTVGVVLFGWGAY
ncbi:MAG: sugar transferase [Pseudomonadota bacterium]